MGTLGLTFQNDCKFSAHAKAKRGRPTKLMSTHTAVLRVFRKECYNDYLFYNIVHVFPNLTYWLSVHGASNMDLNILPQFLD